ncbi:UNVERIFIED_CONTAM: hypothetical protein K2H54_022813 [Gekko kuhli]
MSNHTSSILTVTSAAVRMEGMKICTGQCQGKSFQKTVELQVYSLPDTLQLDSEPEVPTDGQPAHLSCLASQVYPPDAFTLSWFQGDERVERHVEEEMEDSSLFTFRSELEIPMAAEQTTYRCEAQLQIGQHLFHRSRTVTIQAQEAQEIATTTETTSSQTTTMTTGETPERPVPATDGNSSHEAITGNLPLLRSTERPSISTPVGATTAAPSLESWTSPTVGRHPSTGSPSTAWIPLGEVSAVSSEPPELSSTAGVHSMWTQVPIQETSAKLGVTSKALPTIDQQPATELVSATSSLPTKSTAAAKRPNHTVAQTPERLCRPVITPFPPQGTAGKALRITCHTVECHKGIQVQWVETPLAQSQYHQEKAEGRSTLAVDSVSSEHQGVYRCVVMTSQPQMASIRVELGPSAAFSTNTVITIGAAGSLLGLFLTIYVSRRVWQRYTARKVQLFQRIRYMGRLEPRPLCTSWEHVGGTETLQFGKCMLFNYLQIQPLPWCRVVILSSGQWSYTGAPLDGRVYIKCEATDCSGEPSLVGAPDFCTKVHSG